ncbi:MAG TPA: ribosome small subunit-dependent GTPase A [Planctomycetota bacterium]|jgi:ribosome biogenesis GTPase|nr:ribosome small subunit-dependent GTPase A [Planctomycetota bacterium]
MSEAPAPDAIVLRVDARQCDIARPEDLNASKPALLRGRLFEGNTEDRMPVAVGDHVRLTESDDGLAVDEVLPRRNTFARRASGEEIQRQLLATNFDKLVLVTSFGTPSFSSIMADRILVAASFAGIPVALVINKTDKAKRGKIKKVIATYENAGYSVLCTSAEKEEGITELSNLLRGKISVLYGLSGVGKSSLLNCLEPGLGLRTKEVSSSLKSGRHTTTFARMWPLEMGGAVIDTPGVRVFRPWGIPPHELRLHYPEMLALGSGCHFPDCTHRNEPDCAILSALETGELPASRHRSYIEIMEELESVYGGTGENPA